MIAEALAAYACAIERSFDDRVNGVGASEIGQCARMFEPARRANERRDRLAQQLGSTLAARQQARGAQRHANRSR